MKCAVHVHFGVFKPKEFYLLIFHDAYDPVGIWKI